MTKRHGDLQNGDVVNVQGFHFRVTNLRIHADQNYNTMGHESYGTRLVRYTGVCTDAPVNDRIRGTGYDGGTYGALENVPVGIIETTTPASYELPPGNY